MFITFAAASNEVIQSECMDKDGVIERFKNKNCTWVGLKTERKEKKCRKKKRVRIHCMKTCNNCPLPSPPEFFGFVPVKSSSTEWNDIDAFAEVEMDLKRLGSLSYSMEGKQKESNLLEEINDYAINRKKNVKSVASKCKVYAGLLTEFPDMSDKLRDGFYESMMNIALAFNGTYVEKESFIEGVQMRGWPFKIASNVEEFESYQGGNIMEAVALAAEQAALRGDVEIAVSFALTVAGALYDGFLTKDLRRTKVRDDDGSVVYVPESAPEDRRSRFREVYAKYSGEATYNCPGQPQAINHGISSATAAIGLVRAFGAIGWLEGKLISSWELTDADGVKIELKNYTNDLDHFVSRSAKLLTTNVCNVRKTGISDKDNYAGPDGKEWYRWKYRKMSTKTCPSFKSDKSNRPEDIAHAKNEITFATKARSVGNDYYEDPNYFGIYDKDIHRFLMTVLNRFIIDPKAEVVSRFSCDLNSETDPSAKSCNGSRQMPNRLMHSSQLLSIVNAARDLNVDDYRCDVLSVVNAILPMFLEGHEDFQAFGYSGSWKFILAPLITKYYFYWYEAGVINCQKE